MPAVASTQNGPLFRNLRGPSLAVCMRSCEHGYFLTSLEVESLRCATQSMLTPGLSFSLTSAYRVCPHRPSIA